MTLSAFFFYGGRSMEMVRSENLVYEYIRRNEEGEIEGIRRAVDGVEIHVKKGDFVAILGHNGSGKSTMAKMMNAILYPGEGTLWVDGIDTRNEEKLWEIRQTAGMVFQNPDNQLVANVVEEDVAFGPENLGVETGEIWKRVEKSLKSVGMWKYRHRSPNHLSGGQKQRVAIAGIMAMKPKCIILDEPTAMLDPNGRRDVIDTVRQLNREENVTVILITHYMEEVTGADRVIVMDQGKVVMEGTPKEVFSQVPRLKELRLTVPHVTGLAYELKQAGMPLPDGIISRQEFVREVERICNVNHT